MFAGKYKKHAMFLMIVVLVLAIVVSLIYFQYSTKPYFEFMTLDTSVAVDASGNTIPSAKTSEKPEPMKFDSNNYDVLYHDDPQTFVTDASADIIQVRDQSGNMVSLNKTKSQGSITYYEPGTYKFGASSYVPSYEDSVYLSRTSGLSTTKPLENTAAMLGGFCTQNKNDPNKLEDQCNKISKDQCGSTNCCVLLGGSKCVYGNESGPVMKSNYSDVFIKNRDFYYYQGKCYGNCSQ
jgi:hypothetical protein